MEKPTPPAAADRELYRKRPRLEETSKGFVIPTLDFRRKVNDPQTQTSPAAASRESISQVFQKHQAVYLPGYVEYVQQTDETTRQKYDNGIDLQIKVRAASKFQWKHLHDVFDSLSDKDKDSFCIENSNSQTMPSTSEFLKRETHQVGYCSFLVQEPKSLSVLLNRLPVTSLSDDSDSCAAPAAGGAEISDPKGPRAESTCSCCQCWTYEPCLWVFFGRNPSCREGDEASEESDLQGRPEHTDSISHDGTWHYQLSGTKRWLLRPTPQLWSNWYSDDDNTEVEPLPVKATTVDCHSGDVLIVNTRLWYHQTILPPQPDPSVSYARDFWRNRNLSGTANDIQPINGIECESGMMTNVDGLYATDEIPEGTVIFREDDMPDCELHRSTNPNCEVVELEDGTEALVSIRHITSGEFFCIVESSDEEEDDDEEDFQEVEDD